MTSDQIPYWTLWVYVASLAVQIAGFIGLALSIRHLGKTFKKSAFDNVFSDLEELHKVFVEYPEMRPYFYENKQLIESDANFQRGRAIAEMFFDAFIHMYLQKDVFPPKEKRLLEGCLKDMCGRSEFLLEYLYENKELLDPTELREQVEAMYVHPKEKTANIGVK